MARRKVTVQEASDRLDASVDAIRQRIKRGKLQRAEADDPSDPKVYVWLDLDQSESRHKVEVEDVPANGNGGALVESLQDQVSYLREQLAEERRANDENRRLLLAALERIPQLEAPQEAREPPVSPDPTETPPDVPANAQTATESPQADAPPRPWWRRVFGG